MARLTGKLAHWGSEGIHSFRWKLATRHEFFFEGGQKDELALQRTGMTTDDTDFTDEAVATSPIREIRVIRGESFSAPAGNGGPAGVSTGGNGGNRGFLPYL
jgi:hypothetical protein